MLKKITAFIKKPKCYNSSAYIKNLRKKGVEIGEGTVFFNPASNNIDTANAIFIKIGKYCKITAGVRILAHDYSYSVLRRVYHDIPKKAANTTIGDNVFIGIDSIILMGSKIGNNVIIGAKSVVSGVIPDNEVWAGNPARKICSLDEYHSKCIKNFEKSAKTTIEVFLDKNGRLPTIQELQYFSLLFLNNGDKKQAKNEYEKMSFSGDNKTEVVSDCMRYESKYDSYDEMLSGLGIELKGKKKR